jgi:nucleotide-binding universal stress UspA family protein
MFQKILVPLDGSDTAGRGLRQAIALAEGQRSKASLHLLHVINELQLLLEMSSDIPFESYRQHLDRQARKMLEVAAALAEGQGLQVETTLQEITSGRVSDEILEQARRCRADLIVMGTHGRRGFQRLLIGSNAEGVVRGATVPVMLVRDAGAPGPTP